MADDDRPDARTPEVIAYRLELVEKALDGLGTRIDNKLDGMQGRFVSSELYNADKAGNSARHERSEARIKDLEADSAERGKFTRNTFVTAAIAVLGMAVTLFLYIQDKVPT